MIKMKLRAQEKKVASNRQPTNAGTPFFAVGYEMLIIGKKQRPASAVGRNTGTRLLFSKK